MRTPGRCTNHESCWLANGGRDIWVPVGDDFVCPVCAEPLTAPPLQAISSRSMAVAAAASLALVALAGGAGFGLVRAISFASHGSQAQLAAMHPVAGQSRTAAQQPVSSRGATSLLSINTPAPTVAAPAPAAPKATTPPPASPGTPAPTALASSAPPASPPAAPAPVAPVTPRVASAQPAPATPAPSTVTASVPPAAPAHVAAVTPSPTAPRAAPPQQVAEATPPAHEAPRPTATSPAPKPVVLQAGVLQKVQPPPAKEPAAPESPISQGSRLAESEPTAPPVAPVQAFPTKLPTNPVPRPVVIARTITYGQPPGPEGESVDSTGRWRRHPFPVERSGFLPGPGWSPAGDETVSTATQPYQVAQGDGEESASSASSFDNGATVPSMQDDTGAAQSAGVAGMIAGGQVPALVPQMAPRFEGEGGAETVPQAAPKIVTQLTVPGWGPHMPANVPAERVDVAAADAIDDAPDAPIRLAMLPPAAPAKLVVPEYPPIAEDLDQPGRVNVGCIITVRGEPADCSVTRRLGGPAFATAVLDWLHSGEVRYRPHLVHGHPVPESRLYDVKFVP